MGEATPHMANWRISPVLLALALTGCGGGDFTSWLGSYSKEKPAELVPLTNAITVATVWNTDVGAGSGGKGANLRPRVDGNAVYAADYKGRVSAFDAATGREIWKVDIDQGIAGGPGSGEGLVLVGTLDGDVVALDAATGAKRWASPVNSEVLSTPAVAQGVVVVHGLDGRLTGLDAADGKQRWRYDRVASGLGLRGSSSPVISGSKAICGLAGGKLVAVELATGYAVWETTITLPAGRTELERVVDILGDPLLMAGQVFVGTYQGEVAALYESSGQVAWRRKASSFGAVATDGRALYLSDDQSLVWGVDSRDGAALWKQDALRGRKLSAPAVVGDWVVAGDFEGYLHWLSSQDGQLVARTRVGSAPITAQPQAVGGTLYVLGDDGDLAALRVTGGSAR
jgi:outer membrane protein assembly factor BamB